MDPRIQLATSILTMVLTPLFSALVVRFQLSRTHGYWRDQQEYLRKREEFKLRVDAMKRLITLVNRMNEQLTHHQLHKLNRQLFKELIKRTDPVDTTAATFYRDRFEESREEVAKSRSEWLSLITQLGEIAAECGLYFETNIFLLIIDFKNSADEAFMAGMNREDVKTMLGRRLDEHGNAEDAMDEVVRHHFTEWECLRPAEAGRRLLTGLYAAVIKERGPVGNA